ncbi:hypothetical protein MTR_6g084740 [Medicago truncatula]|uniref:Uncharacterized protein n=1 Tax=Medicago truncatula TaxID=3880 RepID=A0A072UMG4_MEDTR|nr:hypothetical protein MTR_6g084740 [Medicago truncatula]
MHQRIDKVENAGDDPGDRKPRVVDSIKVEAPAKVEASVKVAASSVNYDVWKLRDNEVDTTHLFLTRDTWKDKDEFLGWVRRQANRAGFTIIIRRSCEGHLLAGMEDGKKIVHDLTDSSVKPKTILTNLKKKRKESMTNIKKASAVTTTSWMDFILPKC